MSINDQQAYYSKKEEVLSKFTKKFIEGNYMTDPLLHNIVEMLIRGSDPYQIIENLITDRIRLIEQMIKISELHAKPIIIDKKD